MFSFYTDMNKKVKLIRVFSNSPENAEQQKSVQIVACDISLGLIIQKIEGKLFQNVRNLRIFSTEGIELFEEDLFYVTDQTNLIASNNGEDFNTDISMSEYLIQKNIGQGGFGKVMLAIHRDTKDKKAIKILDAHRLGNAQDIELVFREAEMLKMLNHQNIVKIYKCYTLKHMKVAFIMDYLEGGNLLEHIKTKKKFPENEAKEIFYQISDAISYCHHKKIIHRDLKLENIMFEKPNSCIIKLVDFGIAGIQTNYNVDSFDMGSLRYMPPEILEGSMKQITSEVDIWAMGVILYAILYGSLPFSGKNYYEVRRFIINGEYTFPDSTEVSFEAKNLIFQLLKVNPSQRIKIQNILKHPWLNELHQQKIKYLWLETNAQNQMFNLDIFKVKDENFQEKQIKNNNISTNKSKVHGITTLKKVVQTGITLQKLSKNLLFPDKMSEKLLPKIEESKYLEQQVTTPTSQQQIMISIPNKTSILKCSIATSEQSNETYHDILLGRNLNSPLREKIKNNNTNQDLFILPPINKNPEKYQIKVIKRKLKDKRYYSPQMRSKNHEKHEKYQQDNSQDEKSQRQKFCNSFLRFQQLEQILFQPRQTFQKITQHYYDTLQIINSKSIISKENLLNS